MINARVKTRDGYEDVTAYFWDEGDLPVIPFHWKRKAKKKIWFGVNFCVCDTETSHIDDEKGWIYQWAVKIKNTYFCGRTPSELINLLKRVAEFYHLTDDRKLIMYIHNAQYDVQYLKHYLKLYDPFLKIMTTDAHSVLYVDIFGFKIYCSYRLSNLSLAKLSETYSKKYLKAVGDIDYNIIRYQDTILSATDWEYMLSDVASQYDGVENYLFAMGYSKPADAPITSTGFVRVNCRNASRTDENWRKEFKKGALTVEQYNLCRWAFMGGVCIASFMYAGRTIRACDDYGLGHEDFRSSYPARQMINYFPEGTPSWYGEVETLEELEMLCNRYCCVFELTLEDVHIKPGVTAPYIPSSKCINLVDPLRINGKIVSATRLTMAVTEIDFKWIKAQYNAKIKVSHMLIFKRGKLPNWFKEEVMKYYEGKCKLKHSDYVLYMRSKAWLNAIYGMTATALVRDEYDMDDDLIFTPKSVFNDDDPEDVRDEKIKEYNQKQLDRYYRSYNSFLPYQYALWTTAWARNALFEMITTVGYDNFLYCDTDSVFYKKTPEVAERMKKYRQKCIDEAIAAGAFIDDQYLGEPTPEEPLRAFRALHSKCYAMEEYNPKTKEYELKVTIAGIPKKTQKWIDGNPVIKTNAEELGDIDNLQDGFIFSHNGGTCCTYVEDTPRIETINGHKTELASAAIISNINKEISENMWTEENDELYYIVQDQLIA